MNCWLCGRKLTYMEALGRRDWTGQTITSPACGRCEMGWTKEYGDYCEIVPSLAYPFLGEVYRPECRVIAKRARELGVLKEFCHVCTLIEGVGIKIPSFKQVELAGILGSIREDTEAAVAEAVRSNSL